MEFGVGSIVEGKVTGITKFGAFVSLPEGKSGLVHISEIAYSYVNDVKDHLKEGQEVKVKVIGIDENGRINLSIKKAMDPPPRPAGHAGGHGQGRPGGRDRGFNGGFRGKPAPAEPATFEDRLKQFMASSDSKLSELRQAERRSSRRGGRK
nr:S1 RNA-binding domain-containing protein [uncultured Flavonifractor sp.]